MNTPARRSLATRFLLRCLAVALCVGGSSVLLPPPLSAQTTANSAVEVKRITDRYALTRSRIAALLDMRLKPVAVPANPPNPFYQPPTEVLNEQNAAANPDVIEAIPDSPDISDSDTLRKYAGSLKIGGIIDRSGELYLTINNMACKVGDIITVGSKEHPIYLKMIAISPTEFTLGLNDATLAVSLRK